MKAYYFIVCSRGPGSETLIVNDVTDEILSEYPRIEERLDSIATCDELGIEVGDEGITYFVPDQTTDKDLITRVLKDNKNWGTDPMFDSATVRAYICRVWTSYNAWRKLEIEIMTREQFEQYMDVTDQDLNNCLLHQCRVVRASAENYQRGTSPKQCPGC